MGDRLGTLEAIVLPVPVAPEAAGALARLDPEDREAVRVALEAAYEKGRDDAERRGALQLARIFGALVGMTPAADAGPNDGRLARLLRRLSR